MKRNKIVVVIGILLIAATVAVIMLQYKGNGDYEEFVKEETVTTSEWVDPPDDNAVASEKITDAMEFTEDEIESIELPVDYMVIPDDFESNLHTYLLVASALDRYFDGDVPEVFDFDFDRDLGEAETNLVFNVYVRSDSYNLNMLLDLYGLKVVVTEE